MKIIFKIVQETVQRNRNVGKPFTCNSKNICFFRTTFLFLEILKIFSYRLTHFYILNNVRINTYVLFVRK